MSGVQCRFLHRVGLLAFTQLAIRLASGWCYMQVIWCYIYFFAVGQFHVKLIFTVLALILAQFFKRMTKLFLG